MTFHGEERFDESTRSHLKEYPAMWIPLIVLAVPSLLLGGIYIVPMLFTSPGLLGSSVSVAPQHNVLLALKSHFHGVGSYALHAFQTLPFWLVVLGIVTAWYNTLVSSALPQWLSVRCSWLRMLLVEQYGFDRFNQWVFGNGARRLSAALLKYADIQMIDYTLVEGSGRHVTRLSALLRRMQTGYLYHYVLVMIVGLMGLLLWMLL